MNRRQDDQCKRPPRFVYFDAFAGPGSHKGTSEVLNDAIPYRDVSFGSPLVALHALFYAMEKGTNNSQLLLVFEDSKQEHIRQLKKTVADYFNTRSSVGSNNNECNVTRNNGNNGEETNSIEYTVVKKINVRYDIQIIFVQSKFCDFDICNYIPEDFRHSPMISFIDPFGYSDTPMSEVKKFIGHEKEILINVMSSFIHRFKNKHVDQIKGLFGVNNLPTWTDCKGLSNLYQKQLENNYEIGNGENGDRERGDGEGGDGGEGVEEKTVEEGGDGEGGDGGEGVEEGTVEEGGDGEEGVEEGTVEEGGDEEGGDGGEGVEKGTVKTLSFQLKWPKSNVCNLIFFSCNQESLKMMKQCMSTLQNDESDLCFNEKIFCPNNPQLNKIYCQCRHCK